MRHATNAASEIPPGAIVHTDGSAAYRICSELHRSSFWRDGWDVAYLAETLDGEARRVVLRIFDSFDESFGGTFVATTWLEPDDSDRSFEYRDELRWIRVPFTHPGFLQSLDAGALVARSAPHPGASPYRSSAALAGSHASWIELGKPRPFVALESIEGATLTTLLRASRRLGFPLGPGFALTAGVEIAGALACLHEHPGESAGRAQQIWHGRLDASHVFVTTQGSCKLLTPVRCFTSRSSGSLIPVHHVERFPKIDPSDVDAWDEPPTWASGPIADLYQLGLLLWQMLTGRALFPEIPGVEPRWDVHGTERQQAIETRDPRPPSSIDPQVPASLDVCVKRLLSPAPELRFGSAQEACDALARAHADYHGPSGAEALAAVVAVLGIGADGPPYAGCEGLTLAGDGRDGTCVPATLTWILTS